MSAPTPTGPFTLPLHYLRQSLANSTNFQSAVGAANATEALEKIYWFWMPQGQLDGAAVRSMDEDEYERDTFDSVAVGAPLRVIIELSTPVDYQDNDEWAGIDFRNKLGAIAKDLVELSIDEPDKYLDIQQVIPTDFGLLDPNEYKGVQGFGADLVVTYSGG